MMVTVLVRQRDDNRSDELTEYQLNDRLSFQTFLGLTWSDAVLAQKTLGLFRDVLIWRGQVKPLFRRVETHRNAAGLMGPAGKMIEASCVDVLRQGNRREENAEINQGTVPESLQKNENRMEPNDVAARWATKGTDVHDGYTNHVQADRTTTLIEDDEVTDARVPDSQAVEDLGEADDGIVSADSA